MAIAVVLSLIDAPRDGFYQILPVLLFFVLTGFKDNLGNIKTFICEFPLFGVAVFLWTVFFSINRTSNISNRYAITAFLIIFAGFCISRSGNEEIMSAMNKLWLLLFVLQAIGVIKYFFVHDFTSRMTLFFINPIAEGDVAVVLAMISLFYVDNMKKKIAGIALSFAVVITGSLRLALCILVLLLIAYAISNHKIILEIIKKRAKKVGKSRYKVLTALILLVVIAALAAFTLKGGINLFKMLFTRYLSAFSSMTQDVYVNVYADHSYKVRVIALDQALNVCRQGRKLERILGHGMLSGYYTIKPFITLFTGLGEEYAGPIENAFIALMADYGAVAFILYFGVYVSAIYSVIKTRTKSVRVSSAFVVVIMTLSAFIDMEYWLNLVFFLWIFIGIYLGNLIKAEEKVSLLPAMIFSTLIASNLYFMPRGYAVFRTILNSLSYLYGKNFALAILAVNVVLYIALFWIFSFLLSHVILRSRNGVKKYALTGVLLGGVFAIMLFFFMHTVSGVKPVLQERIDAESEIVELIGDSSSGSIYNDTFPMFYNDICSNIRGTFFSGASMAGKENTTVIVSREEEQIHLSSAGFLYLPISDRDAVYTNDLGVITALNNKGYNLANYNTDIRRTDYLSAGGDQLGLGTTTYVYKPIIQTEVYPGNYTAVFKLKCEYGDQEKDHQVCSLIISSKDAKEPYAIVPISSGEFENKGELECSVPFSCRSKGCYFAVSMDCADDLSVESITYVRTSQQ